MLYSTPQYLADLEVSDPATAKAMAEAQMNRLARQMVRGKFKIHQVGVAVAGIKLVVEELAEAFNAEGLIVSSRQVVEPTASCYTEFHIVGNTEPG